MKELSSKTYFEQYGEVLLRGKGISKTLFAEKMGIKKQNVNALFATKNILVLKQAAAILNVPVETLIADADTRPTVQVYGFAQINDKVYTFRSAEDMANVLRIAEEVQVQMQEQEATPMNEN